MTRPRDVRIGPDRPVLLWHKRKWHCRVPECERKVFTEALPEEIPARARITTRARRAAAQSIGDHLPAGVRGRRRVGHGLADRARRVRRLRRRGAARRAAAGAGARDRRDPPREGQVRDRDVDRGEGVGRPVRHRPGRSGRHRRAVRAGQRPHVGGGDRLAGSSRTRQWRAGITHVSMDTSATYARAARLALPHAVVVVDRFHLVALANRAVTEYRRELAWARRGRRGRKIDPEWAQRNRLLRAARVPHRRGGQRRCTTRCARPIPSGGLEKCWQGKEMLRHLLALAGTDPDRNLTRLESGPALTTANAVGIPNESTDQTQA